MLNHILLVDDDEDEHLFFQWSLEKINTNLSLLDAFNEGQAIEILKHTAPEIIFLDIHIKGENGFDCLLKIKSTPAIENIPVYMYSTEITETTVQMAMDMGASGCLKKSFSNDSLGNDIIDILNAEPLLKNKKSTLLNRQEE